MRYFILNRRSDDYDHYVFWARNGSVVVCSAQNQIIDGKGNGHQCSPVHDSDEYAWFAGGSLEEIYVDE